MNEEVTVVEAPGTKQLAPRDWLVSEKVLASLKEIAIQDVEPLRYAKLLLASANDNPKILECTPVSIMLALGACVSLGLEPNSPKKEAWIIPYSGKATFQAGFQGLEKLARRSGVITDIQARAVHKADFFEFEYGLNQKLVHRPAGSRIESLDDVQCAYSIVRFNNGAEPSIEVMPLGDIQQARKASKGDSPAWKTWASEMCRKVVFKRHAKWLPQDDYLARAIDLDTKFALNEDPGLVIDMAPAEEVRGAGSGRLVKEEL